MKENEINKIMKENDMKFFYVIAGAVITLLFVIFIKLSKIILLLENLN